MGKITKRDKESILQLVLDCTAYNFSETESLEYIEKRFGKSISGRTYRRYKCSIRNGDGIKKWMYYYSTTGAAVELQNVLNATKHLLESSMRRLLLEENKETQNDILILKLKEDIRQDIDLVMRLGNTTPVLSSFKDLIENFKKKADNDKRTVPLETRMCP